MHSPLPLLYIKTTCVIHPTFCFEFDELDDDVVFMDTLTLTLGLGVNVL